MKIENLKSGMIVKNYNELCKILEIKATTGNSKIAQLNELKRYCDYVKNGNKFFINKIIDTNYIKTENRGKSEGSRNNIYGKYVEALILDLLVRQYKDGSRKIYMSKDRLLQSLSMINENYTYCKFNHEKFAKYIEADNENVKEFYSLTNSNLLDAVERALKSLNNKFLVEWKEVITIVKYKYENDYWKEVHETINDDELMTLQCAELLIANQMGFETKQQVYMSGKLNVFKNNVCDYINENGDEFLNIKTYYKSYDIIFHPNVVSAKEKIDKYLMEYQELQNTKFTLNGVVSNQLLNNAKKRQEESQHELSNNFEKISSEFDVQKYNRRSKENYIADNESIVKTVIQSSTNNLKNKIKQIKLDKDTECKNESTFIH
jgi:hypothetical protein